MKNIPKILKAMFAVFFVLQVIFYTQLYANRIDESKLDNYVEALGKNNFDPFSMSVSENGDPVYLKSIGYINGSLATKTNYYTGYRIGELSKTFTSIVILQMAEEKMIQLGTPVSRFFPNIPNAKHISIQDLLSHKINILDFLEGGKFYKQINSDYVFEELAKESIVPSEFLNSFSDPNYLVLGIIIEKVNNKPFSDVVKERIFEKAGMSYSYSNDYSLTNTIAGKWDLKSVMGSGSIVSTPMDMNKFITAIFNGKLLTDKSLRIILSSNDPGIGLKKLNLGGKICYNYSGYMEGFVSQISYFPEDNICISFSGKVDGEDSYSTMEDLVRIIYGS